MTQVIMWQPAPAGERFQPDTEAGWLDTTVTVNFGRFKGREGKVVDAEVSGTGPGLGVSLAVEVNDASGVAT